ncbi:MAG: hypothetical protein HZC37_13590 [Burkholderiales bacterium]|nr:hypothetical protein [Burkholderiales bacterium]
MSRPADRQPGKGRRIQADERVGFMLRLEVRPGLPPKDCRDLERRLEDYAEQRDLLLSGHQLVHLVTAADRPLSVNDQVALLDWLVDLPGLVSVRVGPLVSERELHDEESAFLQVLPGELALIGLTLLYRCGRITPALYLQILGGCVRPAHIH